MDEKINCYYPQTWHLYFKIGIFNRLRENPTIIDEVFFMVIFLEQIDHPVFLMPAAIPLIVSKAPRSNSSLL